MLFLEVIEMEDIFCRIIKGDIPSKSIYEDEIVKVIMDVNPRSDGHLLIIPKKHYQDIYDIEKEVLNHILEVAKNMCLLVSEKLDCDGVTLEQNNGIIQEVTHFHLHVIPKYKEGSVDSKTGEIYNNLSDKLEMVYKKTME